MAVTKQQAEAWKAQVKAGRQVVFEGRSAYDRDSLAFLIQVNGGDPSLADDVTPYTPAQLATAELVSPFNLAQPNLATPTPLVTVPLEQLQAIAAGQGVEGASDMTKDALLEAIESKRQGETGQTVVPTEHEDGTGKAKQAASDGEQTPAETSPHADLPVPALKQMAEGLGITGVSNLRKAELLAAIDAAEKSKADGGTSDGEQTG